MRKILIPAAIAATALALIGAGCGDDDDSNGTETAATAETASGPEQAIAEIGEVRRLLDESLAAYRGDDAARAEELATDAYLEHFELVEGPLGAVDAELNEELEELIRDEIRETITSAEPAGKLAKQVKEANEGLDKAERALEVS